MTGARPWLLPALLTAVQLAVWPGLALVSGGALEPVTVAAGSAVILTVAVLLCWRRRAPVAVTAAVVAVASLGAWVVPGYQLTVISTADLVAVYSVAVWTPRRTTSLVGAGLVLWEAALVAATDGIDGDYPLTMVISICVYALVVASGRARCRWHTERAAAARRIAEAEAARSRAADAERHRLARDLHDVTAHHLTAIVVTASAAQVLGEQRPELRAEALGFAASTGRDTLAALRQLVAVAQTEDQRPASPAEELADLADGFRRLGQQVTVEAPPMSPPMSPPVAVTEAVRNIAREALTNTLRYAPGSTIRLVLRHTADGTELIVDDDGAASPSRRCAGLGGGRGLTGMRERAEALGGTVEAGPHGGDGWRVRALLPSAAPGLPAPVGRVRRWVRSDVVIDVAVVVAALLIPLGGLVAGVQDASIGPAAFTLFLLVLLAHAGPLLARRHHPWPVLAAVSATMWLGPLLVATRAVPADESWLFLFGAGAELAAVHTVGRSGGRPSITWLAPIGVLGSAGLSTGVLMALDRPTGTDVDLSRAPILVVGVTAVVVGVLLAPLMAGSWAVGCAVRARRRRLLAREDHAVVAATTHAIALARAERARVAAGLHDAVLEHAGRVSQAAADGDLTAVLASSREALTAMRALLSPADGTVTVRVSGPAQEVTSSRSA